MSDFKDRVVTHHKSFGKYIAIAVECFANSFVETRYFLPSDNNSMLQYNEIRGTDANAMLRIMFCPSNGVWYIMQELQA